MYVQKLHKCFERVSGVAGLPLVAAGMNGSHLLIEAFISAIKSTHHDNIEVGVARENKLAMVTENGDDLCQCQCGLAEVMKLTRSKQ